jgi:hypothetical protein
MAPTRAVPLAVAILLAVDVELHLMGGSIFDLKSVG